MTTFNKQHGGTLAGLIIGMVIGLGIAVGVAMMITKTPLPFTNKFSHSERITQPAGEITDPNKPLYGKKPVAADQGAPEPAQTAPAATVIENTIKAAPAAQSGDAGSADENKWIYYLQAGAFRSRNEAENMRARLALEGFEANVSERQSGNGTLYRVRIGPFNKMDTMNRVRGKLSDGGVDVAVVRIGK